MLEKVRIQEKFALFSDYWSPKIIDELNDSYIKVAKFKGEFVWHYHESADELFWILKGSVTLKLRDREIVLNEGDMFVVPKNIEHCPVAQEEAHVVLIENKSIVNTGNINNDKRVEDLEWI